MLELKVLISKLLAVDRLAAGPVVVGEVAPLQHERRDHPVKARPLVTESLFAGAKGAEVLGGLQ